MPTYEIEQRETWHTIVTYNIDASTEDEALQLTNTGTCRYDEHQILNRDPQRVIHIQEVRIN